MKLIKKLAIAVSAELEQETVHRPCYTVETFSRKIVLLKKLNAHYELRLHGFALKIVTVNRQVQHRLNAGNGVKDDRAGRR